MLTEENSIVLARLALREFGYDPDTVALTFVKLRENCVFRADASDGAIALRLHRPGYRSGEEIAAESQFIELLAERGFPVVRLVPTVSGAHTAVVRHDGLEVVVDAQRWVEGSRVLGESGDGDGTNEGLEPAHFEAMGALAARMHDLAEELAEDRVFSRVPWDAEGILGERALWGDALRLASLTPEQVALLTRTRARIMTALAELGTAPNVFGAIHADFTPENLLVCDDGLVLIDFDDFGNGWYLFDLATALFFLHDHPLFPELRAGLLRGYASVRPFEDRHVDLLDLFLVARGFTYLGWAATRPGTDAAAFVEADVVPLVVRLAAELEADRS